MTSKTHFTILTIKVLATIVPDIATLVNEASCVSNVTEWKVNDSLLGRVIFIACKGNIITNTVTLRTFSIFYEIKHRPIL